MGALYLAVAGDRELEKLCVIKTVLPHLADREYLQRFRDEAKVVVRLSHGNLVNVLDAGQVDGKIYIAMDFVEGKDLVATWNRCAKKEVAFPIDVAAHIVKELARGLAYAHDFGGLALVHRDVSPGNVLLSYPGEVKLTDFGLASSTLKLEMTAPGVVYGKLSYMAPEQARHQEVDRRTDVYAAGIILWELLTGRQLFPTKSDASGDDKRRQGGGSALERVRNPQVSPPSAVTARVPAELDAITMRALAPEPENRYQQSEDLRADLGAYLARTAPSTDAARLQAFLRGLFEEDIERERRDRDDLIAHAQDLLSGPVMDALPRRPARETPPPREPSGATTMPLPLAGEDPRIGQTIADRYHLRRLCGEGGMGRVYEAEHVGIGRRVAAKILHPAFAGSPDIVERFRREARAASTIGHPNIVEVTDSGTAPDGSFFFTMEYLEGVNLRDLVLSTGPLPVDRALAIAVQICRALHAAHTAGVIHRDVTPVNVMLIERDGTRDFVKVLDFGIAKHDTVVARPDLTHPGMALGTPKYMSPEQGAGMPADVRSEIYSVGALLYEMLTARSPYDGETAVEVLHKKATEAPTPLREVNPTVPDDVERAVHRAMAREPDERHSTMLALEDELRRCQDAARVRAAAAAVSAASVSVSKSQAQAIPKRPSTRHPRAEAGSGMRAVTAPVKKRATPAQIAGAGIALAATFGAALWLGRDSEPPAAAAVSAWVPPAVVQTPVPPRNPPPAAPALRSTSRTVTSRSAPTPATATRTSPPARPAPLARRPVVGPAAPLAAPVPAEASPPPGPSNPPPQETLRLAQSAYQQAEYVVAVRKAKQALRAGAGVEAHLLLGAAFLKLRRYADASKEYADVLKVEPNNASARAGYQTAEARGGPAVADVPPSGGTYRPSHPPSKPPSYPPSPL